jgi:hypothetical protein
MGFAKQRLRHFARNDDPLNTVSNDFRDIRDSTEETNNRKVLGQLTATNNAIKSIKVELLKYMPFFRIMEMSFPA